MNQALYIYSIIQEKTPRTFLFSGLAGAAIYTLAHRGVSAVVSDCKSVNFDKLTDQEMREGLIAHQRVNEELIKSFDVVPMAFGMVARNKNEVLHTLSRAYLQFAYAFKRVENRFEFAVHTYLDEGKILKEMMNDSRIKELQAQLQSSEKNTEMAAKINLGKMLVETLSSRKNRFLDEIETRIKACSHNLKRGKVTDESMIGNFAVLIDKSREKDLDETMGTLGTLYGDKLRFKYIGPLAPASFTNINLQVGNFDLLNNARKVLSVPQLATLSEIRDIYFALARKYHPDRHECKNNPRVLKEMTRKMQELQDAYETMANYYKMNVDFSPELPLSFKREDVEKSLLVKES